MSYLNSIKKRLDECSCQNSIREEDEIEEVSDSGGVAPIATPYAFGNADDDTIEIDGFKKAPKKKINTQRESVFTKMSKELYINEVSYKEYKEYPGMSSKKKINTAIQECNSALYQIERFLKQNRKLREEEGIGNDQYWKSTAIKLVKMDERLKNLRQEIKNFGLKEMLMRIQEEENNNI
jgi:hypothetical protein